MRTIIYCFIILAAASLSQCYQSRDELMNNMRVGVLTSIMQEREALQQTRNKIESICSENQEKFEEAFIKFRHCTNLIDDENETVCSAIQNHFEKCAKPIVAVFEECVPERSKGVPSLISKSILATSNYLCKTDGEHIFELSNLCARSQNYRTERCARKINSKIQQFDRTLQVPSKEEVCEFLFSFKGCFQSHLQASCGNPKTREAFINVYNAMLTPCQANDTLNEIEVLDKREWVDIK